MAVLQIQKIVKVTAVKAVKKADLQPIHHDVSNDHCCASISPLLIENSLFNMTSWSPLHKFWTHAYLQVMENTVVY